MCGKTDHLFLRNTNLKYSCSYNSAVVSSRSLKLKTCTADQTGLQLPEKPYHY